MASVEIAVRTIDQTTSALKSMQSAWQSVATPLNQTLELFKKVGAAIDTVVQTIKDAAQVQATANTFDHLSASIGATSDTMLRSLRPATQGMVSDLELMRASNQFLAMGLATTEGEAGKLAQIGSTLGLAFRGDAAAGMEEFALLLANQSIPRLDTFGISAGAVRTRIAELQQQTPGLSRETAFMTAVMEQAEITLGKVGNQSATTAGELAQLETDIANTKNEFKSWFSEALLPAIAGLNDLSSAAGGTGDMFSGGIQEVNAFANVLGFLTLNLRAISMIDFSSWDRFVATANGAVVDYLRLEKASGNTRDTIKGTNEEIERATPPMNRLRQAIVTLGAAEDDVITTIRNSTNVRKDQTDATAAAIPVNEALTAAFERQQQIAAGLGDMFSQALEGNLFESVWVTTAQGTAALAETSAEAAFEVMVLEERASSLRKEMDKLAGAVADGNADMGEAAAKHQALQGELDATNGRIAELTTATGGAGHMTYDFATALYEAADSAGASAGELAGLGVGLGLFDEAAAESALKAATLKAGIEEIGRAFANNEITRDEAIEDFNELKQKVDEMSFSVNSATGVMYEDLNPAIQETGGVFREATGDVAGMNAELNAIPRNITVDILVKQSGQYVPPELPGPSNGGAAVGATGGLVRGGTIARDSVPALLMPGERVLTREENQAFESGAMGGGSGMTFNIYLANPTAANARQIASMTAQEVGRRLGRG